MSLTTLQPHDNPMADLQLRTSQILLGYRRNDKKYHNHLIQNPKVSGVLALHNADYANTLQTA
jgi:hypothetical protein